MKSYIATQQDRRWGSKVARYISTIRGCFAQKIAKTPGTVSSRMNIHVPCILGDAAITEVHVVINVKQKLNHNMQLQQKMVTLAACHMPTQCVEEAITVWTRMKNAD